MNLWYFMIDLFSVHLLNENSIVKPKTIFEMFKNISFKNSYIHIYTRIENAIEMIKVRKIE